MSTSIRTLPRVICALLLIACGDDIPSAPVDAAVGAPQLMIQGSPYPTQEQLAELPIEFSTPAYILRAWTKVGFIPHERRAFGQSFMEYWATNARQELKLDLRFEHGSPISKLAQTEADDLLPAVRTMWTNATLGVMGECGHIVEGTGTHTMWHKALVSAWNLFAWGRRTQTSTAVAFQPDCPPPPQESEVDGGEGGGSGATTGGGSYEEDCEICQQWFFVIAGTIVDEWWECTRAPNSVCGLAEM